MLMEPQCLKRKCVHYHRVEQRTEEEVSQAHVCAAFPVDVGGIPKDIAYGDNLHLSPIKGQKNKVVFEKEEG